MKVWRPYGLVAGGFYALSKALIKSGRSGQCRVSHSIRASEGAADGRFTAGA